MALGYVTPYSVYLGAAAGLLTPSNYIPATNTNSFGDEEGIAVAASLASDAAASLKFFCPNPVPTGTLKLRSLLRANATSGVVKYTVRDGNCTVNANPGATTLTTETQQTLTWTTADIEVENKLALTGMVSLTAGDIIIVGITFNTSGWTMAQALSNTHTLVWE